MPSAIYRFGDYHVDRLTRELHRNGTLMPLSAKVFDCLAYLIEHRDRAVGRDELIAAVWGRADVSDDVLAQTLLRARRAVGDTGNEQHAIRTIPRFGYRWVQAVDLVEAAEAAPPALLAAAEAGEANAIAAPTRDPAARVPYIRRLGIVIAVAAASALLLAAVLHRALLQRVPEPAQARADAADMQRALLVLPVAVTGDARDAAWIRLGTMDYIAARLRSGTTLAVIPSSQTLALVAQGDTQESPDAGELHRLELATHAAWIVAPRAHFSAARWHVSLDVYHDGGDSVYQADDANPLDAAAQATARFLASLGMAPATPPADVAPDAELVQRIDAAMLAGDLDEARRLVDNASAALREAPAVAVRMGQVAFRLGHIDDAQALFAPLAEDAPPLAADVRAQAQMGLGAVAVRRRDFAAAERDYAAAIDTLQGAGTATDPIQLGNAYMGRGVADGARGRFDEAIGYFGRARVELERAGDIIGAAAVDTNLGILDSSRGRVAEAEAAFDRAVATFTRFGVRDNLAASLLGRADAQLALVDRSGALASSAQASELAGHLENPILVERIGASRVRALLETGQLTEAARLLDGLSAGGKGGSEAEFAGLRGRLLLERGDTAAAAAIARDLLGRAGKQPDSSGGSVSDAAWLSLEANRRAGRIADAEPALAALRAEPDDGSDRDRAYLLELLRAELSATRGDSAAADRFHAALEAADRNGTPLALVRCGVADIRYLIEAHRLDEASALVGRLAPYADRDYGVARATAALHAARGDGPLAEAAMAQARALAGERDIRQAW